MNLSIPLSAHQCNHLHWLMGTFCKQWMLMLGAALEQSTAHSYTSTATSYISFCQLHEFPTEPMVERLCFYIVYMSHHVKPKPLHHWFSWEFMELTEGNVRSGSGSVRVSSRLFKSSTKHEHPLLAKGPHQPMQMVALMCRQGNR